MAMTGLDLSIFDLDFPTPDQIKRNYFEFLDVQQYSDDGEGASMSNFEDSDSSLFGASLQNYREYVGTPPHAQEVSAVPSFLGMTSASGLAPKPEISFALEPIQKYRFRYLSEEGSHGHLTASNSTANRHSAPTIEVKNIPGDVELRLALYTTNGRCLHKLLRLHQVTEGRGAQRGRRTLNDLKEEMKFVKLAQDRPLVELRGLGIIKLTKDDLQESGKTLEEAQRIHREFNRLDTCLGVEAYVNERKVAGPVFSTKITNLRCASQLKIMRRSILTTSAGGGQEMWLLTDKVRKGDIEVRISDGEGWDDICTGLEIFHQFIIICRTPAYPGRLEASGRTMHLYLYRKSDQESSDSYDIKYVPDRVAGETFDARKRRKTVDLDLLPPQLEQMRALHQNGVAGETLPLLVPQELAQATRQEDRALGRPSRPRPSSSRAVASQPHSLTTLQASHSTPVAPSYFLDVNWASTQPNLQLPSCNGVPSAMQPPLHLPYAPQEPIPFQSPPGTRHVAEQSPMPYARSPQPMTTCAGHLEVQAGALYNGAPTRQENRLPHDLNGTPAPPDTHHLLPEAFASPASSFHLGHERLQEPIAPGEISTMSLQSFFDFDSDFELETPCPPGRVGTSPSWSLVTDSVGRVGTSPSWSLVTDSVGPSYDRKNKKPIRKDKYDWEEEEGGEEEKNRQTWGEEKDDKIKSEGTRVKMREQTTNRGESRKCKNRTPWELVDVNTRDRYGDSLLHYAVRKGDAMAVLWLISQGADVNQQAQLSGDTPLHLAVKYDMRVVLQVLLDLENLDLHVKNDAGQTFLDVLQPDSSVSECVLKHARTREMSQEVCFSDASLEATAVSVGHLQQQPDSISPTKSTSEADAAEGPTDEARGDEKDGKAKTERDAKESRERRTDAPQISLWYYMFLPLFLAYCYSVVSYWSKGDL
nr:uncharacterized protein LOC113829607 [Penaeus vannamei]